MDGTYKVADATTWRELDGEIVALDTKESIYFAIGGIGTTLWPLLVSGATKQDLVMEITSTFDDAPPEQAAGDVDEFITSLSELGLIESRPG
jgi:hypothetical protein